MLTVLFFKKKNPDITIHWPLNPLIQKGIAYFNPKINAYPYFKIYNSQWILLSFVKSQLHKIIVFGKLKICTDIGP